MLPLIFIFLAAFFKAVADTLEHHCGISIFKRLNPKFWDPDISYRHTKFLPLTRYRPDAWHLSNSLFLWSMIMIGVTMQAEWIFQLPGTWYTQVGILGAVFIVVFNLFYNKIFR
jgi:hypothetical protein